MKPLISVLSRHWLFYLLLCLAVLSVDAHAEINNTGILDNVIERYAAVTNTWANVITMRATWLFWTLAVISMVWTFGMMVLRKADLGEFYAEFVRFTIFTGFFWWLLTNGPQFALSIMDSLRQIGAEATGLGSTLAPSGIVDIGVDIFMKVVEHSSIWDLDDSICGILIAAVILVVFALVGVNMLLLLISSWILAYAGIFFLGFGGSRWTSDIAVSYFRTVLNIAGQLFAMVLLVGIGKSFIDQYYASMSSGIRLKELGTMLVVAAIMLALVKTVPGLIGSLAGGNASSLGSGFGAGAAIGAATMAGAAISSGGAALLGTATSAAGGAQALTAAFSRAMAADSTGGASPVALMNAAGSAGESSSSGGAGLRTSFASAMGDSAAQPSAYPGRTGATDTSTSSPSESSDTSSEKYASTENGHAATSPPKGEAMSSSLPKSGAGGISGLASAIPSKAGRVAARTVGNIALGAWDVARAKASDIKEAAAERIADTTGGKMAAAIQARSANASSGTAPKFDGDSLSAGTEPMNAEAEIAAFRDRDSDKDDDA